MPEGDLTVRARSELGETGEDEDLPSEPRGIETGEDEDLPGPYRRGETGEDEDLPDEDVRQP